MEFLRTSHEKAESLQCAPWTLYRLYGFHKQVTHKEVLHQHRACLSNAKYRLECGVVMWSVSGCGHVFSRWTWLCSWTLFVEGFSGLQLSSERNCCWVPAALCAEWLKVNATGSAGMGLEVSHSFNLSRSLAFVLQGHEQAVWSDAEFHLPAAPPEPSFTPNPHIHTPGLYGHMFHRKIQTGSISFIQRFWLSNSFY